MARKLTPQQIEEILLLKEQMEANGEPFSYARIGQKYGVSGPTIRRNISPTEYDKKPKQTAYKYDPEAAQKKKENCRIYQIAAYKKLDADRLIIEKLDSTENKQQYIKDLILKDILSKKKR